MQFLDDSLLPENQQPLVIQVAPYGPEFLPGDSDDIPVTMDEQIQKAVDCYNAGATVLHVHCREADGHGSKRLSLFNEMLARLREAVPSTCCCRSAGRSRSRRKTRAATPNGSATTPATCWLS
jgi:uncharacterized protein (DUF849 family)